MTAAIVIARGGSKRLPRKNVRPFCGHPLVSWSIVQAKCSHLIDQVYLSTDDDEIENIGLRYGAIIIRRPDWPNADLLPGGTPIRHAVKHILAEFGETFDTVIGMLPTSPIKRPEELDLGIEAAQRLGVDIAPMVPRRETFLWEKADKPLMARSYLIDKDYKYLLHGNGWSVTTPQRYLATSVDYDDENDPATDRDIDATIPEVNRQWRENPPAPIGYVPVPEWQEIEVDTIEEFELGEIIFEHYVLKGRGMEVYYEYGRSKPV